MNFVNIRLGFFLCIRPSPPRLKTLLEQRVLFIKNEPKNDLKKNLRIQTTGLLKYRSPLDRVGLSSTHFGKKQNILLTSGSQIRVCLTKIFSYGSNLPDLSLQGL